MANLIETLDAALALYAPLLVQWMQENPSFHGIETVIRPDDPSAFPLADVPLGHADGYSSPDFEEAATEAMLSLDEPTQAILSACHLFVDDEEALSVSARRVGGGETNSGKSDTRVEIVASLGGSLGGLRASRSALCLHSAGLFMMLPSQITFTTGFVLSESEAATLKIAAEQGSVELARCLDDGKLLLNHRASDTFGASDWMAAFPEPGLLTVVRIGEGGVWRFSADSFAGMGLCMSDAFAVAHPNGVESLPKPKQPPKRLEDLLPEILVNKHD